MRSNKHVLADEFLVCACARVCAFPCDDKRVSYSRRKFRFAVGVGYRFTQL